MSYFDNKEIAFKLIKTLKRNPNSLSVTLTGSYSEHFNPSKAGDIDVIIICKNLNKKYFDDSISIIKKFKKSYLGNKYKLIINTSFGPIKFYKKNTIVFHLMIYDLKSHINHTINSPFTCYDWERSKIYVGKSLKELSPVYNLQLRDFSEARRSTEEYLKDLSRNRISYREYKFKNRKIKLIKKYFKIDNLNKRDFIYHIIKFLLINYIKYEEQKNFKISKKKIKKKFLEIVQNKIYLSEFIKLEAFKTKKNNLSIKDPKKLAIIFIKKFDKHIKKQEKINKIYFSRHKKTKIKKEIFIGQKLNPSIIEKRNNSEFKKIKFNKCYSSPSIRCKETAEIVCKNKEIITNNHLKEIDYGNAEGMNFRELNQKFPKIIKSWKKGFDPKFPNGESLADVFFRLNKFIINKLVIKNFNYLIFTHNVVLRCLIGSIYGINKKDWFKINVKYFDLLEFRFINNKLVNNIERKKYRYIFKNFN